MQYENKFNWNSTSTMAIVFESFSHLWNLDFKVFLVTVCNFPSRYTPRVYSMDQEPQKGTIGMLKLSKFCSWQLHELTFTCWLMTELTCTLLPSFIQDFIKSPHQFHYVLKFKFNVSINLVWPHDCAIKCTATVRVCILLV